ncbi:uncharacterized protein TNCV_659201 [Trichonephila clavipes]|nr:uncharacterized protein TNCV_659201 [Trichonephila clavipes]
MPTDPENYFSCLLIQYVPFFSEDELIDEHYNARDAFLARKQQLRQMHILKHIGQEIDNFRFAFHQVHDFNLFENLEEIVEAELKDDVTEQSITSVWAVSLDGLRIVELDCSKLSDNAPCTMKEMKGMRQLRPQASRIESYI